MKKKVNGFQVDSAFRSIKDLSEKELPIKASFKISRLLKKFAVEFELLEEGRLKLVKKYGERKGELLFEVPPKNRAAFEAEANELYGVEIEIDFCPIAVNELGDINISPKALLGLEPIFEEENQDKEEK